MKSPTIVILSATIVGLLAFDIFLFMRIQKLETSFRRLPESTDLIDMTCFSLLQVDSRGMTTRDSDLLIRLVQQYCPNRAY